jgi:hypothetical protein
MGALGGLGMFSPAQTSAGSAATKTRFYVLDQMFLKNGSQLPRLHEFTSKTLLPVLNEVHSGPKLYLESVVAPHMPQFAAIYGFDSLEHLWSTYRKVHEHAELRKQFDAFERASEPPFEHQTSTLLEAADYSTDVTPLSPPPEKPRIFELRVYHSPTTWQLTALHERFKNQEIKIFRRVGVHPILYGSTIFGSNVPNLTYLTPFDSLGARERAWNAFGADPEWRKVSRESAEKNGQISIVYQIALYRAAPYSPIR